jgi:predicted RNase H-like nuclease (RuvC/YqgF family)
MVNGVNDDEVETVDFGEDIEEDCGEPEKLSRELSEEETREEKENEYTKKNTSSSSSSSSSSSRIQSLVKTLSKSVRNLESAVQKERTYRKMADAEVEKARKCIMDEVDGENADLKIAAARLTKALSLLKHTGDNYSSFSV